MEKQNKMNKKGWLLRDFTVALILFSAIPVLAFIMVQALANDYHNPNIISSQFSERYDRFNNYTNDIAGAAYDSAQSKEGFTLVGTFSSMFFYTFTIFALAFNSVTIFGGQVSNALVDIGVPSSVAVIAFGVLIAVITVTIVYVIASSLSRGRI